MATEWCGSRKEFDMPPHPKNDNCLISFDPGMSTGYVVASVSQKSFTPTHAGVIWWEHRFVEICELLEDHRPFHIIVERFALYPHMAQHMINSEFEAVQVIGNIQACAYYQEYDPNQHISTVPASVKTQVKVLKEHRFILDKIQPNSPHIYDAYKLLRYWWIYNVRKR